MIRKKVIQGKCPYCNTRNSVILIDYYHVINNIPYAKDVPLCEVCDNDCIELRKVNNRRYIIVGKY